MTTEQITEKDFGDLFGTAMGKSAIPTFSSGGIDPIGNILEEKVEEKIEDKIEDKVEENVEELDENGQPIQKNTNTDILGTNDKVAKKVKYDFTDTSGYFQDRFKSGKFVPIVQDDEQGNAVTFIPKTPEEFDEVIDLQVNYKLEQKSKDLDKSWYSSKSPAWQAVAKFAEMTDDPTEIVPFLQGIKTIESVNELDPNDLTSAEKIVKIRLQQRGDDDDMIAEQIDALKTTDKLITTAQKYKPALLQQEKQQLNQMLTQKNQQEQAWKEMVSSIRENAIKAIESPIFGKQKLKQDEKSAIYELIAIPSEETKGYRIFNAIDDLYEKGDFEKLRKIALILSKEEALVDYISTGASTKTAAQLQKQLRVSTEARASSSSGSLEVNEDIPHIQRNAYQTPRFGR